jgi:poly(3-hydroxybutyrate) depolymerase
VAPTSLGQTWAIQGNDRDSPHLASILAFVRRRWTIDQQRILLTGMSDGGTFSYTSGLLAGSPVMAMANDSWASVVGLGAMRPDMAYNISGTTEVLGVAGWVPPIKAFFVAMDNQCVFAKAAVYTQNNVPVQTTQLVKSYKYGPHAIAYEHLVNGGAGANLSGIAISLGSKQLAGFPLEICPVDIYVRH